MFNLVRNLASKAYNAIRSVVSGQQNKSSGGGGGGGGWGTPVQQQPAKASNPVSAIGGFVSSQKWLPSPVRNFAAEAAQRAAAAEAAARAEAARIKEENRRRVQGQLDQKKIQTQQAAQKAAGDAMNWIKRTIGKYDVKYQNGDWGKIFDKSGNYKNQGGIDGWLAGFAQRAFDPDVKKAKADWQNWYNNTQEGQAQKATDEFEKVKQEYKAKAEKLGQNVGKNQGGVFGWFDDVSGADDRRKKKFAEDQIKKLQTDQIKRYEDKLNNVLKWQAANKATLEKQKFASQAEYDAYLKVAAQESELINDLEYTRAATTGSMEGWGKVYESKSTNTGSKVGGWFSGAMNKVAENPLFKYTIGGGSENIPSVVTAPSRVINWFGNVNTPNRDIYKYGGETANRLNDKKNAWQSTFNQRNFNIRPYTDKAFDKNAALKAVTGKNANFGYNRIDNDDRGAGSIQRMELARKYQAAKSDGERDKILNDIWNEYNRANRNSNSLQEFAADPLFFASALKVGKATKLVSGAEKIAAGTSKLAKPAGWFAENAKRIGAVTEAAKTRVGENKVLQWLNKEHKTPGQNLAEKIDAAKLAQGGAQERILDRVNALNKKLLKNPKLDTSIIDDVMQLSDKEIATLKRLKNGELAARDKIKYWTRSGGLGSNPAAQKVKDIAKRLDEWSELQSKADKVTGSRFGQKTGRVYLPQTNFIDDLSEYNFRKFKKGTGPSTAKDLRQSLIDRYFVSNLDDVHAAEQIGKKARWSKERELLLKQYDDAVLPARAEVNEAYRKSRKFIEVDRKPGLKGFFGPRQVTINKSKRALLNTASDVVSAPTRAWKKAVLKFNPAWTVNNVLYNTQANYLASGSKGLIEQAKMLRPKNWEKAMVDLPEGVRTNLSKEIGKGGKLNRFYNNVEDWSRVSAFRGAKAKGLTDEQALKRVNKYLFDYKTKNWERPLKTVLPFWQWNKNLAKATATMPFDRPVAAAAYNRFERSKDEAYDKDFETMRAELKKQGYTDQEIDDFKKQKAKYFKGRLKVGDNYITTPFSPFSENGNQSIGVNPVMQSLAEWTTGKDKYGRDIKSEDQGLLKRYANKMPQFAIGDKAVKSMKLWTGKSKPTQGWIGEKGSEGYGLTKEKQGYDKSKPNYSQSLDPSAKLGQDVAAFFGIPRAMKLDKTEFLNNKKYGKIAKDYFGTDWNKIEAEQGYAEMTKQRDKFFADRGVTAADFYEGVLSKNDTENTKRIKQMKTEAAELNKKLFDEYARQPHGTRSSWAADKLRQLNAEGYFDKNPFLKSFDWLNPETIARADKGKMVRKALQSGDWSEYRQKYGGKTGTSQKSLDYQYAKRTGDWSKYRARYGTKTSAKAKFWQSYAAETDAAKRRQMLREHPEFAKRQPKSEAEIAEGKFWASYAAADKATRKQLLAANPLYNRRANWTDEQWDDWKAGKKSLERSKLRGWGNIASLVDQNLATNEKLADPVLQKKVWGRRQKKVVWRV